MYRQHCVLTAFLWLIWELAYVAQVKAVHAELFVPAVLVSLCLPFVGFLSTIWWVEEPTLKGRLGLTASGALGAAMGTFLILTFWR